MTSCQASLAGDVLSLGNSHYREQWRVENGRLRRISFVLGGTSDWVEDTSSPIASGVNPGLTLQTEYRAASSTEAASLIATITNEEAPAAPSYQFRIFPNVSGSSLQVSASEPAPPLAITTGKTADGIEDDAQEAQPSPESKTPLLPFALNRSHAVVTEVSFAEQSDQHAEFVFHRSWQLHPAEGDLGLCGNLVILEDPSNAEGLIFLLQASSRLVRDSWSPGVDFRLTRQHRETAGWGFLCSIFPGDYPLTCLGYKGGKFGRIEALATFQKAMAQTGNSNPPRLLSNTWGDRSRANRLNEDFVRQEIAAAGKVGIEVLQLDDGWQKGKSANTVSEGGVWDGFWTKQRDFWEPDTGRFPSGLAPLVDLARQCGLQLGLWYAPDSTEDLSRWAWDAEAILKLWRDLGVCYFKLDAIKLTSRLGEKRLQLLLRKARKASDGQIVFDLDATAELRPTYWGQMEEGMIFLQNRYTDWANYYPHQTLRALWSLSHYVWPTRLRLEFLNPRRNADKYGDDPLRPSAYPPDTLFAITMPSSPLAWLENSELDPNTVASFSGIIAIWKDHREAWSQGTVLPIGKAPDGWQWTGFASVSIDRQAGYFLIFRELSPDDHWPLPFPQLQAITFRCEVLAGSGSLSLADRILHVEGIEPLHFIFARFYPAEIPAINF